MAGNRDDGKKLDLPPVFNDAPAPQRQIRATEKMMRQARDPDTGDPIGPPEVVIPEHEVQTVPITQEQFDAKATGGVVKQKSWQRALTQHQRIRRQSTAAAAARTKPKGNW